MYSLVDAGEEMKNQVMRKLTSMDLHLLAGLFISIYAFIHS